MFSTARHSVRLVGLGFSLAVSALVALSPVLAAQAPETEAARRARSEARVREWQKQFRLAEELLRSQEWKKAHGVTDRLVYEAIEQITSGPSAALFLADLLLARAVANAGLGRLSDACWDLGVAFALHPSRAALDVSAYEPAGSALRTAAAALAATYQPQLPALGDDEGQERFESETGRVPPRKIASPEPHYPGGKSQACIDGTVRVDSVIDEHGKVILPALLDTYDPVLALMAFETVKNWRFEPSRLDGVAVPTRFRLTVNFKRPTCGG